MDCAHQAFEMCTAGYINEQRNNKLIVTRKVTNTQLLDKYNVIVKNAFGRDKMNSKWKCRLSEVYANWNGFSMFPWNLICLQLFLLQPGGQKAINGFGHPTCINIK